MNVYRVFPFDEKARAGEPGHPLFAPRGGSGRVDNSETYRTLYCSSHPEGAVAEAFGRHVEWTSDILRTPGGSPFAIATFTTGGERIVNLDDANALLSYGLRPSNVVTRERKTTQSWALRIYKDGAADGVGWWSYYKPEWASIGFWNRRHLRLASVEPLSLRHPSVVDAAGELLRAIRPR